MAIKKSLSKKSIISKGRILSLLILLVIITALYGLYVKLESKLIEEDKGYQGEALTNNYLAAEYFLLKMGQQAEKIKLFSANHQLPSTADVLLIPSVRLAFDRRRSNEILKWVKNGGHLIITGQVENESLTEHHDYILSELGLFIDRKILDESIEKNIYPVNIMSLDDGSFLQVDFDDYLIISKTAEFNSEILWSAEDNDRTHGLQIKLGDGKLTLLSEMRMFKNEYIDGYDHAEFLFSLIQSQSININTSVFYYSVFEDSLSLLQWLWINAQLLLVSLLLLILIVLWFIIPRFGPLINVDKPIRRQFLNHLTAAGNYHWRMGNYNRLLADVRMKLSYDIKRKYPEWANLNKQDRIAHFSDISQLQSKQIEMALFNNDIQQVNDFVNIIKLLEVLRKKL